MCNGSTCTLHFTFKTNINICCICYYPIHGSKECNMNGCKKAKSFFLIIYMPENTDGNAYHQCDERRYSNLFIEGFPGRVFVFEVLCNSRKQANNKRDKHLYLVIGKLPV